LVFLTHTEVIWMFECHRWEAVGSGYIVCLKFMLRLQIQAGIFSAMNHAVELACNITLTKKCEFSQDFVTDFEVFLCSVYCEVANQIFVENPACLHALTNAHELHASMTTTHVFRSINHTLYLISQ